MRLVSIQALRATLIPAVAIAGVISTAPARGADYNDVETRRITREYAACVIKRDHRLASRAILENSSNDQLMKKYSALISSECLGQVAGGVEMKFTGDLYRYALADALVSVDFAKDGPTTFDDRLPLAHLLPPSEAERDAKLAVTKKSGKRDEIRKDFERAIGVTWLSQFGECIVRDNPVAARLWLLTKPDVPEEVSRVNALRPAFSGCLGDMTLKFSKSTLRGTVAINYYRLASATQRPVMGTSK